MSDFLSHFVNKEEDDKKTNVEKEADTPARAERRRDVRGHKKPDQEQIEFDPTYKKRKQRKRLLLAFLGFALLIGVFFTYRQFAYVKVPSFQKKEIAQAREWGAENGVRLNIKNIHRFDTAPNKIIKQSIQPGKRLKKGEALLVTVSMGPDPEAPIYLPAFDSLNAQQAKAWVKKEKADNVSIIEQYEETIQKGTFIKQEAANKELDLKKYKRKERLAVYYSKGKETFEKTIEVLDFSNKPLAEVTEWVRKNEVKLVTEKVFSHNVPLDSVVSQEQAVGTKIAKQDELKIQLSKGKPLIVPNYGNYTMEEARELSDKLSTVLKSAYSESIAYGHFISQNIAAGTELDEKDNPSPVEVTYSEGRPYIKDLRKNALEGDLPKLFFDTYTAKGATITYDVYYVDSEQPKGTVVEMSHYGEYLPLAANISIGISLGNRQPTTDEASPTASPFTEEVDDPEPKQEGDYLQEE